MQWIIKEKTMNMIKCYHPKKCAHHLLFMYNLFGSPQKWRKKNIEFRKLPSTDFDFFGWTKIWLIWLWYRECVSSSHRFFVTSHVFLFQMDGNGFLCHSTSLFLSFLCSSVLPIYLTHNMVLCFIWKWLCLPLWDPSMNYALVPDTHGLICVGK